MGSRWYAGSWSASVEWLLCTPIERRANSCREPSPTKTFSNVLRKLNAIRLLGFFPYCLGLFIFHSFLTMVLWMEPRTLYRIAELYSCAVTEPFHASSSSFFFFLDASILSICMLSFKCICCSSLSMQLTCFGLFWWS